MFDEPPSRQEFLEAAVATGGAAALSACLDRAPDDPAPAGTGAFEALPSQRHTWNEFCREDDRGSVEMPRHQVLLCLDLDGERPPDEAAHVIVEGTFRALDRAYERSHRDIIWSVAYSPRHFDRSDDPLPDSVDLPEPWALSSFETPDFDRQGALVHLASDRVGAILEAEQALLGETDEVNGVAVDAGLSGAFSIASWRTGFVGAGLLAEHQSDLNGIPDGNPVPEASSLFVGFEVGFVKNQTTGGHVTIDDGPFAGAITKRVANIRQRLSDWYDEEDRYHRVMKPLSPGHTEQGLVEDVGDNLGDDSDTGVMLDSLRDNAFEFGHVGYAQKIARANRDDEGSVRLLRRHLESDGGGVASLHLSSLQYSISAFEEVRETMNGADLTDVPTAHQRANNGISEYIFVRCHGNFLVPPRKIRALPTPTGEVPGLDG